MTGTARHTSESDRFINHHLGEPRHWGRQADRIDEGEAPRVYHRSRRCHCGKATWAGKPLCEDHITEGPYAQWIQGQIQTAAKEAKRARPPVDGIICQDILSVFLDDPLPTVGIIGWWIGSRAKPCPLTHHQVHRHVVALVEAGLLEFVRPKVSNQKWRVRRVSNGQNGTSSNSRAR